MTKMGYEFNDPNVPMIFQPPVRAQWGAFHAGELQYLFSAPTRAGSTPAAFSADQQRLAAEMVGFWAQFAHTGTPNATGSSSWPQYASLSGTVLSLEPAASRASTDFGARHRCAFWTGS